MHFTHGHALLIGVGSYQFAPQLDVPITVTDATALAEVLRDPGFCGYPPSQVTLLHEATATRAAILDALRALARRTTIADTVLLFYSGHGEYSADGTYHLTAHDTRFDATGKVVPATAISQADLITALRDLPVQRLLVLVNACHAGELSPTLGTDQPQVVGQPFPAQTATALLATGSGRLVITACREQQVAYIGPDPRTIFAQALIDGLRGQAGNRAGYISAFDLYTYLYFAVREAVERQVLPTVRQRYGLTQEPELTVLKGVGPFAVALFRGATPTGDLPTDHTPPETTALRTVAPEQSRWAMQQITGERGVSVAGSVSHSIINTGDGNTIIHGGTIRTGPVSGQGIAIGPGARASVGTASAGETTATLFAPIYAALRARPTDPAGNTAEVLALVQAIEREVQPTTPLDPARLRARLHLLATLDPDLFRLMVSVLRTAGSGIAATVQTITQTIQTTIDQERSDD
ncbi:caspase family protein [Chloroflexus sp.]|uniref:caspase family protein n=1 Tax=Chloroflexus sp. TaxID=1904827 RepID=UPI0021DEE920|nr:caspase family protein [Chloroflexus sp.]GIV94700.1 MAG: hypothetical protein KatS3mg056_3409 [Chloroflexus sp.]